MKRMIFVFLTITLMLGTTLVIMSKHWFSMWLGLELSTLSMIPLLKSNKKSRSNEATMKYFLVQAFSAAILLKGTTLNLWLSKSWKIKEMYNKPMSYKIILLAIMMKLGLTPCHFWFPDVLSGLSFIKGIIISCWQKIAPLFMLMSMATLIPKEMMLMSATTSVLMGGWGGLNQVSTRKILAFSSMSHLGWITATLFFAPEMSMILFSLYMLKKVKIFLLCHKNNLTSLSNLKKTSLTPMTTIMFTTSLLSLGGLPPLSGFMKKLMPLMVFVKKTKGTMMPFLMVGTLTSLYFYLRMTFKTKLMLFPKKSLKTTMTKTNPPKTSKTLMSILSTIPLLGIILLPAFFLFM